MDFQFSESQEMFKRSVRDFLERECPRMLVREIEDKRLSYSAEIHKKMADLGWLGLMIPAEYDGTEGDWVYAAIFYEETGRSLLPSPHYSTVTLGGQCILALGSKEQKRNLLPKIAQGEAIYAFALTEAELYSGLTTLATSFRNDGRKFIINGAKLFISHAPIADCIIVVARSVSNSGVALFLVDKGSSGLSYATFDTMTGDMVSEVVLDDVKVSSEALLGELNEGEAIAEIVDKAKVVACAEALGMAQVALEMLVDYSKQRVIFGRPIGSFQVLQHRMADLALAIESARWLVYSTAWMSSQGITCAKERAMAQLYTGQICPRVTEEVAHCYGAASLVRDHDLTLYYRRAKAAQLNLGYYEVYDKVIAKEIGL